MRFATLAVAALAALSPLVMPWTGAAEEDCPVEPELFAPGVISGPKEEYRITFTPDGRTAYFARADISFLESREATILVTRKTRSGWTEPVPASFSGTYPDIDPVITPDGKHLYFSSIRPVNGEPRTDVDVWVVDLRRDGTWGAPRHLGAVNRPDSDELYPSVARDGRLYVGSDRAGGLGGWDIWTAVPDGRGGYREATNVGAPVNSAAWEFNPTLTPSGRKLVWSRLGFTPEGGLEPPWSDLYAARRTTTGFAEPEKVAISTDDYWEFHASFSADGEWLYWIRVGDTGGDFYRVPTWSVGLS